MKIRNTKIQNPLNFGSIPLYKATIFQKKFLKPRCPLESIVSMAEKNDLDREGLDYGRWYFTTFGDDILKTMEEKIYNPKKIPHRFLFVEIPSASEKDKFVALASYTLEKNALALWAIQSKSEKSFLNKIKGAGSIIMYTLSKIAQKNNLEEVFLTAATNARNFYKKLGLEEVQFKDFVLPKTKFDIFQKELEQKFNIQQI